MNSKKGEKKSKFNESLGQPIYFSDNSWVVSAEIFPTVEEAFRTFKEETESWGAHDDGRSRWQDYTVDDIQSDRVRYCCQGSDMGVPECGWFVGASGKGSKPVWVLPLWKTPKHINQ